MRAIFLTLTFLALAACTPDREDPPAAASPAAVSSAENWRLEISLPHEVLPVELHLAVDFSEAWFTIPVRNGNMASLCGP